MVVIYLLKINYSEVIQLLIYCVTFKYIHFLLSPPSPEPPNVTLSRVLVLRPKIL
jgi:hypothetical protein